MKLRKFLPGFAALFVFSFVITSCLNDDNLIPANCFDGLLNNGEFDVDCGGPACDPCPPSCENGLWDPDFGETGIDCGGINCDPCPSCSDGEMNGDEIGIDCGGEDCEPCSTTGSCINGVLDGEETGVDCGGPDCPPCTLPTCDDGIMNGDEEGIDCGGTDCPACPTPTCEDGVQNGTETGIDCGDGPDGVALFCPVCQTASAGQIIFRANNSEFNVYGSSTATVAGDIAITLTMEGSSGDQEITFFIPNAEAILPGQSITFNQATSAAGYVVGLDYGVFGQYLSSTANSSVTVTFDQIDTTAGSPLVGTFSGVMWNFVESFSLNITEGSFNLTVQ